MTGRASGEHWVGRLYMRHVSIYLTRWLLPTRVTPDGVTWAMIGAGIAAVLVLTVPHVWAAVLAVALVQLQALLDCADGELARARAQTGPKGVYLDRLGHYVTDAGLAVAVGVHADGGLTAIGGWTTIGLAAGFLVLLVKAETDLVHVARAQTDRPRLQDTTATALSRLPLLARLRAMASSLPLHRALLALEMSGLALAAAIADWATRSASASRVLDVGLLVTAAVVVAAHLLGVTTSSRLR